MFSKLEDHLNLLEVLMSILCPGTSAFPEIQVCGGPGGGGRGEVGESLGFSYISKVAVNQGCTDWFFEIQTWTKKQTNKSLNIHLIKL